MYDFSDCTGSDIIELASFLQACIYNSHLTVSLTRRIWLVTKNANKEYNPYWNSICQVSYVIISKFKTIFEFGDCKDRS